MPHVSTVDAGPGILSREVRIPPLGLAGTLRFPTGARALVIFAHGSGSRARPLPHVRSESDLCPGEALEPLQPPQYRGRGSTWSSTDRNPAVRSVVARRRK